MGEGRAARGYSAVGRFLAAERSAGYFSFGKNMSGGNLAAIRTTMKMTSHVIGMVHRSLYGWSAIGRMMPMTVSTMAMAHARLRSHAEKSWGFTGGILDTTDELHAA